MAFSCNQFLKQEKKYEFDIKSFVKGKFNSDFPMFSRINVNGPNTLEVFKYVKGRSSYGDKKERANPWNFTKFLLDEDGNIVKVFSSTTKNA